MRERWLYMASTLCETNIDSENSMVFLRDFSGNSSSNPIRQGRHVKLLYRGLPFCSSLMEVDGCCWEYASSSLVEISMFKTR